MNLVFTVAMGSFQLAQSLDNAPLFNLQKSTPAASRQLGNMNMNFNSTGADVPFTWYVLLGSAPLSANLQEYPPLLISRRPARHESGNHMPMPAVVPNFRSAPVRSDASGQTSVETHAGRRTIPGGGCPIVAFLHWAELCRR